MRFYFVLFFVLNFFATLAKCNEALLLEPQHLNQETLVNNANGVAAMIYKGDLVPTPNGLFERVTTKGLISKKFCESEKFVHQPTAAQCSGILISDDLLLTSNNCIQNEWDCKNFIWSFDYKTKGNLNDLILIEKDSLFSCQKILGIESGMALIKLDHKTNQLKHKIISLGKSSTTKNIKNFYSIGHPIGLPTKMSSIELDPGSPLFDKDTHLLIGINLESNEKKGQTDSCKKITKQFYDKNKSRKIISIEHINSILKVINKT